MNRVRIIAGEFAGREASVVAAYEWWRVYVLIDGTDNPVPYKASELEAA